MARRPRVHTVKWDRCVKKVRRRGSAKSAAAVCTAALKERGSILKAHRRRARNPRAPRSRRTFTILALRPKHHGLVFQGEKFGEARDRAVRFPTRGLAVQFARHLKRMYAAKLKGWRLRVS